MGYFLFGAYMTSQRMILPLLLASLAGGVTVSQAGGQTGGPTPSADKAPQDKGGAVVAAQDQNSSPSSPRPAQSPSRADAYYNFTMGHIYEQQYEATSKAEYATQAIEAYKKAYALDPKSPVIGERS